MAVRWHVVLALLAWATLCSCDHVGAKCHQSVSGNQLGAQGTYTYARLLLSSSVIASSVSEGVHSASGNLSTTASYRSAADSNQVGLVVMDGTAGADEGNAYVAADSSTASKEAASANGGKSMGSGLNASASQGLTAVSTTTNNATAANVIHNSAASGSTAAQLRSNTTTQSGLSPAEESSSSNGSSHGISVSSASGRGSADNAVSDSTSVASQSTPDKVTAVQDTITSANAVSKHQSEDISDSSAATAAGVNNVQSAVSGKK